MDKCDAVLQDFQELKTKYQGDDSNVIVWMLKDKMRYVDSFSVPTNDGRCIYAALDWEISEDELFYVFYIVGATRESSKIYEIEPAYGNKEKAIRLLNRLTGGGDAAMYEVAVVGETCGIITVRCKAISREDAIERAAYYLVDAHCDAADKYGKKKAFADDMFTDFYFDSISKIAPIVSVYSMYSIKLCTSNVEIAIHTKAASKNNALNAAACCLRDCIYDETAFEIFEDSIKVSRDSMIKEKGLIYCEDEGVHLNVVSVTKI